MKIGAFFDNIKMKMLFIFYKQRLTWGLKAAKVEKNDFIHEMCVFWTNILNTHTWPRFKNTALLGISNFRIFLIYRCHISCSIYFFWFPINLPNKWKIPNNHVWNPRKFPITRCFSVHVYTQTYTHTIGLFVQAAS